MISSSSILLFVPRLISFLVACAYREPNALNYTYTYEDAAGQPVDIYILGM